MSGQSILLCGATGLLGGEIARRLAVRKLPVKALVRPNSDASALEALGITVVRGDLRERSSLDAAVAGVNTVISTVTAMVRMMNGEKGNSLHDTDDVGYVNLIDACERAGVRRFVFVSAIDLSAGGKNEISDVKLATERHLRDSKMREVIVRSDAFQESWLAPVTGFDWPHGKVTIYGKGTSVHAFIAIADVAEAMIRLALVDDPPRLVEIGGPEAISRVDAAKAFERAAGRPLRVRHIPRPVLRIGSQVLRPVQPLMALVMNVMLVGDSVDTPARDAELRALGIQPKPVSRYIREVVARGAGAPAS